MNKDPIVTMLIDGPPDKLHERVEAVRLMTGVQILVVDSLNEIEGLAKITVGEKVTHTFRVMDEKPNEIEKPYGKQHRKNLRRNR